MNLRPGPVSHEANVQRDRPSWAEPATFLGVTVILSAIWNATIVAAGGLASASMYVTLLMWSPAAGALVTQLIFHRTVSGLGWDLPAVRWAALAYVVPIAYATAAYGVVWLSGLGAMDLTRAPRSMTMFIVLGTLISLATATGEEIGWRGYFVPALARRMSPSAVILTSGLIWAAWHLPLIVLAGYNAGTSMWYEVLCFTVGVVALSVPLAWLRLRSGSLWPAALFHASHNLYVQGFFDRVTVDTGPTRWLTGEFGAALAIALVAMAAFFWRARGAVFPSFGR